MVTNPLELHRAPGTQNDDQGPQARCGGPDAPAHTEHGHVQRAVDPRLVRSVLDSSPYLTLSTTHPCRLLVLYYRSPAFVALSKLFSEPQYLSSSSSNDDPHAGLTAIDYEEANAGYQAAYSRLAASETVVSDPVAWVNDPREYLGQELVRVAQADPRVKTLIAADPAVAPLMQALATAGYRI